MLYVCVRICVNEELQISLPHKKDFVFECPRAGKHNSYNNDNCQPYNLLVLSMQFLIYFRYFFHLTLV